MERALVLVRHGQSEWNLKNLFTGWENPNLTDKGITEASNAGKKLKSKNLHFNRAYTSVLTRAQKTLELILDEINQQEIPIVADAALNERDYGDLTGLNKDEARKKWGEEQVHIWRRSYNIAPPGGESLRDTLARVLPYYIKNIQPKILRGENIIIAAHGNSLRALIMAIEGMEPEEILKFELNTGIPVIYRFNSDSTVLEREILDD